MSTDDRPWETATSPEGRWAGYLDPSTGPLRTLSEEPLETHAELRAFEDDDVEARSIEARVRPITGSYGIDHLQAIHRRLFQDVYPWAGEIRTVNISKGIPPEPFLSPEHAASAVDRIARRMHEDGMLRPDMDDDRFVDLLARRFSEINEAHPFREGNGRTQRHYFDLVARDAGRRIDWSQLSSAQNIAISAEAREGRLAPLRDALRTIVTVAPVNAGRTTSDGDQRIPQARPATARTAGPLGRSSARPGRGGGRGS
ncbi:Fic/DOC family protein [Clavibacter michiganensis]|uniref:Fic/DOC family protein n=1 Tax=Clavibacter michiganensis TaxID=28447 RepID=UPI003EBD2325